MDALTELYHHLRNPLCQNDGLSEALFEALHAKYEAPQDCHAAIREHFGEVLATASDPRTLTTGTGVRRRLSPMRGAHPPPP